MIDETRRTINYRLRDLSDIRKAHSVLARTYEAIQPPLTPAQLEQALSIHLDTCCACLTREAACRCFDAITPPARRPGKLKGRDKTPKAKREDEPEAVG